MRYTHSVRYIIALCLTCSGCATLSLHRATRELERIAAKALADCEQKARDVCLDGECAVAVFDACFAEVQKKAEILDARAKALGAEH